VHESSGERKVASSRLTPRNLNFLFRFGRPAVLAFGCEIDDEVRQNLKRSIS